MQSFKQLYIRVFWLLNTHGRYVLFNRDQLVYQVQFSCNRFLALAFYLHYIINSYRKVSKYKGKKTIDTLIS